MLPDFKMNISKMVETARLYPWTDAYAYAFYLAQTYYYVSHSTRLLGFSAGTMKTPDAPFHRRFLEHAAEEKGHELMALNDLEKLGYKLSDFPELPETRMFWEPQYYKILHKDPLALMGYIVALEAIACEQCPPILKILESHYPAGTFSFVKAHAEDDPDHLAKAFQVIASLPPERRKWIEENFHQTVQAFQYLVVRMMEQLREKNSVKAA